MIHNIIGSHKSRQKSVVHNIEPRWCSPVLKLFMSSLPYLILDPKSAQRKVGTAVLKTRHRNITVCTGKHYLPFGSCQATLVQNNFLHRKLNYSLITWAKFGWNQLKEILSEPGAQSGKIVFFCKILDLKIALRQFSTLI
jgi:hypothetical protein